MGGLFDDATGRLCLRPSIWLSDYENLFSSRLDRLVDEEDEATGESVVVGLSYRSWRLVSLTMFSLTRL
jgi:hypothetical protein